MAQCRYCNRKGLFMRVSNVGLCSKCESPVLLAIKRHMDVIEQSAEIVDNSKKFETKMSRLDVIIQNYETLKQEYHSKGIVVVTDIDGTIAEFLKMKIEIIDEEAYAKTQDLLHKATLAKTLNSKINNANKAIVFLKELEDTYGYSNKELTIQVFQFIHQVEFEDLLLKAEKEEFKGNTKKAIDKYQDLLFFLKKDHIDDHYQEDEIKEIEDKISELASSLET